MLSSIFALFCPLVSLADQLGAAQPAAAGLLPAAERTSSGYRVYTATHAQALRTFLALVPAHGYPASRVVMRAVNDGDIDSALRTIDESHAGQLRDRATLDAVATAIGVLTGPPNDSPLQDGAFWTIGELARRLGVTPATLRKWERTGILLPARDRFTGHRRYDIADVRDAELAHLLRRGGYLLADIAPVVAQVRGAGSPELLVESLVVWRGQASDGVAKGARPPPRFVEAGSVVRDVWGR
jgi:DNA-binding transcriptional MerR regulator